MNLPRSNPDLGIIPGRRSKRESRAYRQSKQIKDFQFKIANPFRNHEQQNYLPANIKSQIQQLQYISAKSIKCIQLHQCRRTSNFERNLEMMQELAKKQQQKYKGMLSKGTKSLDKNSSIQEQLSPINIADDDEISLELNGFFDQKQRIIDNFNIFREQENMMQEEQVQPIYFYSNQELSHNYQMDQQLNGYLQ